MDRIGIIQMTSGANPDDNLDYIEQQIERLASQGARWIVTPENAIVFGSKSDYHRHAEKLGCGLIQQRLSNLAKQHKVWLIVGSMLY